MYKGKRKDTRAAEKLRIQENRMANHEVMWLVIDEQHLHVPQALA